MLKNKTKELESILRHHTNWFDQENLDKAIKEILVLDSESCDQFEIGDIVVCPPKLLSQKEFAKED